MQLEQINYVYIRECEWNENMNGKLAKHGKKTETLQLRGM